MLNSNNPFLEAMTPPQSGMTHASIVNALLTFALDTCSLLVCESPIADPYDLPPLPGVPVLAKADDGTTTPSLTPLKNSA
jgi:hypothetical protein